MAEIIQGGKRDLTSQDTIFAITNLTVDTDMDCNGVAAQVVGDVLGTLIRDLIRKGVINGTIATH